MREPLRRGFGLRFGAYWRDYLPTRVVEVHFAAGQLAEKAKHLSLFILDVVRAAIAILMRLISGKGIASNEWHQDSDMPEPYPIGPSLAHCRTSRKPS